MPNNSNRGLPDIWYFYQYCTAQFMCKLNDDKIGGNDTNVTWYPEGLNIAHP